MSKVCKIFLILFLCSFTGWSQVKPKDACRAEDGRILFTIDLKWTAAQRQEVARLFDIDSILMAGVWSGKSEMTVNGVLWRVKKVTARIVELSKSLTENASKGSSDVILIDDQMAGIVMETTRESVPYGINKFTRINVFRYAGGKATFFLPGHAEARQIFLSGTFNNWSTLQMPMWKNDSGWIYRLDLLPGKYQYKYVIDGRWAADPFNRQCEDDFNGGENSVVFCFNHIFRLAGQSEAKRVVLCGSFNNWREDELKMIRIRSGWGLQLFLREGTHAYKYLVDGNWINDPSAAVTRPDGAGNTNSFIGIGDSMIFQLKGYPNAKKVILAGSFNGWNTGELFMQKTETGWILPYALAPGVYEYRFIVDGTWLSDPDNPLHAGDKECDNSVLVFQPNYTFRLDGQAEAKKVAVAGSFNGWNGNNYRMTRQDGKWVFPISLRPGKYTYKFVVDGKWIRDPGNQLWEENEYGTGNSVIWIEP